MSLTPATVAIRKIQRNEHQLVAARSIACEELVLREEPVLRIDLKASYRFGDYCWDLVDELLAKPQLLKAVRKLNLLASPQLMDPQSEAVEAHLVSKHKKSRRLVRELYFLVGTNNVGILTSQRVVRGYGVYPLLSRCDHSCAPNARLYPGPADTDQCALRATQDIRPGEVITWSYFREDEFFRADFATRNEALVDIFRFACRCERCQAERPKEFADVGDVFAYFEERLKQRALALARVPGGLAQVLESSPLERHRQEYRATTGSPLPG